MCNTVILVLSLLLIIFISIDTFRNIPFLEDDAYMTFQLWVCIAFITDFFLELWLAPVKSSYIKQRILFFLLSIPYLNIIHWLHIYLPPDALYFVRFIPLARGALALSIVVGYLSSNKITSIFASYLVILLASVYFGALIVLEREHTVNPQIPDFGMALWVTCMNCTTLGCDVYPVTVAGKIVVAVLSCMGMMMFPLFTVYITNLMRRMRIKATTINKPSEINKPSDANVDAKRPTHNNLG